MPAVNFNEATDAQIMDAIRSSSGLEYQARIPSATQAGVSTVLKTLQQWKPQQNQFLYGLVNRIGASYAHSLSWRNPLSLFKQNSLNYGSTIQEIKTGLLQAKEYTAKRDYLERDIFGVEAPYVESNYHEVNRQDYYKFTLNLPMIQRAFNGEIEMKNLIATLMDAPVTSDNLDEFLLMTRLVSEYERMGGFFHVKIADVSARNSSEADAKDALRMVRSVADNLRFLSTHYNAAKLPVAVNNPDELFLITTPEFKAALDVEALAGMFNVERGEINQRMLTIPREQFGIDGCQGILTTKDFFVVADTLYQTEEVQNPVGLNRNYFLHHHQIISASRFVPAIQFSSLYNDEVISVETPVTSVSAITAKDSEGTTVTSFEVGKRYHLTAAGVTTPASDSNKAVSWSLEGANATGTQIDHGGYLEVSELETSTSIDVTAETTWINPANGQAEGKKTTASFTVSGDPFTQWPVEHDHDGDGEPSSTDPDDLDDAVQTEP